MEIIAVLIEKSILAAIAALGFALVFNVPQKMLHYTAIAAAVGYSVRVILLEVGADLALSCFIASLVIGVMGLYWSRRHVFPRPVVTVAAIIPMVPGTIAFNAMTAVVQMQTHGYEYELVKMAISNSIQAISVLVGLAAGLALPSVVIYRGRPIV